MQDRQTGEMRPISDAEAARLRQAAAAQIPPHAVPIFKVGEEVNLRGGRFRVRSIGRKFITFEGLPAATAGSLQNFSATLTDVQAADLEAGRLYVNVHSTAYPDGEIRGQLIAHPDNAMNAGEEATDAPMTAKDEATEAYGEEEEK